MTVCMIHVDYFILKVINRPFHSFAFPWDLRGSEVMEVSVLTPQSNYPEKYLMNQFCGIHVKQMFKWLFG